MAKLTKTQAKRLVRDIESKAKKLYTHSTPSAIRHPLSTKDMQTIEKLCSSWLKKIG